MTTKPKSALLTAEQQVWRYIRRNKKFVFSNVLLISNISANRLSEVLLIYSNNDYIKRVDTHKSIMNSTYVVLQKLPIEPSLNVKCDLNTFNAINKVAKSLKGSTCIGFSQLLLYSKISPGKLKQVCKYLENMKVINPLENKDVIKQDVKFINFEVCEDRLESLLHLCKQKDVKKIQEYISSKEPISEYSKLPIDFIKILETIICNETISKDEIRKIAKISKQELGNWWKILEKTGVVVDSYKESKVVTYILSAKRAKQILAYIHAGSYERNKELKQLWTQNS